MEEAIKRNYSHVPLKELVLKFDKGEERYNRDPMFNQVVNYLAIGTDPLQIIDHLLKTSEEMLKQLKEMAVLLPPRPIMIYPEPENEPL
jgi:hypothetical protein